MYGIPGFDLDGEEVIAWHPLSETDALRVATQTYGLDAISAERLETERDDSFAIETLDARFVLKVAHPADDPATIDFQTRALVFAGERDPELPLQGVVPSLDGRLIPSLASHEGRIARLFDWLPGDLLVDTAPDDTQLALLGDTLGRLTLALGGFEHQSSSRPFAWDVAQLPRLDRLAERFPDDDLKRVFDRFASVVAPKLDTLPRQVLHNDFNPGNVLVDEKSPQFVTGILDFGDVIATVRVADLAVALSYLLFPFGRDWQGAQPFVEAYERRIPLTRDEHEVLRPLVLSRLAERILINQWLSLDSDDRGRDDLFRSGVRGALHQLLEEN
ncbi:MAG TPA: phosphotransferase [Galbitalea sp.]|nr:phosphotransferase [Galbitalea sp.]